MDGPIDLDEPAAGDDAVAGRKAARLAQLRAAGVRCPPGLVLPVGAPPAQEQAFAAAAAERWPGPVAVRTSATWEDHATSAHAGEGHTVLGATGTEAIAAAVRACRSAPLSGGRAPGEGVAVLVQPLLDPDHAGAAFSADPLTGARDTVRIAGAAGLGDRLLEGEVVGSDATVRGGVVGGDHGDMVEDDLRAVAAVVREVAEALGGPQDVEWALVRGTVHVLQARPISVLPVRPTYPTGNGWQKDVAHHSEPLTPFGWWALQAATGAAEAVFVEAGLVIDGLEEVLVGGEPYSRVRPAVGPTDPGRMPPPPAIVLGLVARLSPTLRARTRAARRVLATDLTDRWIADWTESGRDAMLAATRRLRAIDLAGLDDQALVAHLDQLRALVADGGRTHFRVFIPYMLALHDLHRRLDHLPGWDAAATAALLTGTSPATLAAQEGLAELHAAIAEAEGCAEALRTHPHDPVGTLAGLDPSLEAALEDWLATHGWRALNYDGGAPVLAEKPALVTQLLLTPATTPATTPTGMATDDDASAKAETVRARLPEPERATFDRALERARSCHPWREDTVILAGDVVLGLHRRWLREAGTRLAARDVVGAPDDAAYLEGGEVVQALDGTLPAAAVQARIGRRRGEEAWVRAHPGPLTIGHQSPPPDTSALPEALRRVNEAALWLVGLEYPTVSDVDGDAQGNGAAIVTGVGASPGTARGPVRVVRDHRDLERIAPGDVLVCQVASPAWVPVFGLCAAVVADGGGALSHAAVAAREHGLPAVLGTQGATGLLHDGQQVEVDGTAGTVRPA